MPTKGALSAWPVRRVSAAISVRSLVKTFGSTRALDGLDLDVAAGEVHGFLGPNGSGKSTTIRILLGMLRADAGEAVVLGGNPWKNAVTLHRRLAYVPGDVDLWPNLSGGEIIDLLGRLRGGLDDRRRADLLERFELDPTKKARTFSKGNRQKVTLVAALASDIELYLIVPDGRADVGPRPVEGGRVPAVRHRNRAAGRVLLSSHILAEVEALCDRESIIGAGRTVESGTLRELRHLTRTSIVAETARPADGLGRLTGVHNLRVEERTVRFDVDSAQLGEALRRLGELDILSLTSHPPTLEQLFLRQYGESVPARDGEK